VGGEVFWLTPEIRATREVDTGRNKV
jgi:hypothetical protein